MQRFEGRVALVTGAGGGIGRATALRLVDEGASVVCADIDGAAAIATADGLPADRAAATACDVADPESATAAVRAAVERFGALDILVNVAGVGAMRSTRELSFDEWQRTLHVNLTGTFLMCQAAIEPMLVKGAGSIVNMASVAGLRATPYNAAYCASKGGVVMLTKSLAVEFGRQGIRVNCVCPSMVDTAFLDNMSLPADADMSLFPRAGTIIKRKLSPEEVAGIVAYLASDEAAMVTGSAYVIDGGATA
jgi:NAD(P)-dependent dehydrogenase (short-subunit alcohol dehydrogenase family)